MNYIGIDLGTTNSVISSAYGGNVTVLSVAPWNQNPHLMPSVIDASSDELHVFKFDKRLSEDSLIRSIKRKIGTSCELQTKKKPYEISSVILSELVSTASNIVNEKIDNVVIGVPAHFDNIQRIETKLAASLAGLKVLRLINEPTAAALAYGLDKGSDGIFCVYDFGGGTFDFSVLKLEDHVFKTLSISGDNNLGGDDIDKDIARLCCDRYGVNLDSLSEHDKRLCFLASRELKEQSTKSVYLSLSQFTAEFYITAQELDSIIKRYADRTLAIAQKALDDANISFDHVGAVVLVGGMTKSCELQRYLRTKCNILNDINPDEAVSIGAALYAESILSKNKNAILIDVTPLSLGIETLGGGVDYIIPRNTPLPFEQSVEYTTAEDFQTSISFNIVQGESKTAEKCRSLGRFVLYGIPKLPAREAKVTVSLKIDINGILTVTALEKSTGVAQSLIVEPSNGLTTDDYIRILSQAR